MKLQMSEADLNRINYVRGMIDEFRQITMIDAPGMNGSLAAGVYGGKGEVLLVAGALDPASLAKSAESGKFEDAIAQKIGEIMGRHVAAAAHEVIAFLESASPVEVTS